MRVTCTHVHWTGGYQAFASDRTRSPRRVDETEKKGRTSVYIRSLGQFLALLVTTGASEGQSLLRAATRRRRR